MAKDSLFSRAIERAERSALLLAKDVRQHVANKPVNLHVFVAGMQRSGTNMLMDVLERSWLTDLYHETDSRAFDTYEMRQRPAIHALVRRSRAPVFVIKALCEMDQIRSLLDEFTPAKSVWMVRDYNDAVSSALVSFRNFTQQVGRIATDRNSDSWRGRGMSDMTHALVCRLYTPEMNAASAAALIWYFRNVLYFEQGLQHDPRVFLAHYEDMVTAPENEFPRIFDFLGLEYSPFVSRKVFASSIRRHPLPPIAEPVRELCEELTQRMRTTQSAMPRPDRN